MIKVIVLSPHTFSMASIIIQTKFACAWPDQTTAGQYSLVVNIQRENVIKSYFVQDSKDLREAIYHISKLS